jgi:hypothetical protein
VARWLKLGAFCAAVFFAVSACSMFGESTPPPAPSGPVVVNNMPPAAAPAQDGNVPWLMMFAIGGAALATFWFCGNRHASARAEDERKRADDAEQELRLHLTAARLAVTMNGHYYGPSVNALSPSRQGAPVLESSAEVGR